MHRDIYIPLLDIKDTGLVQESKNGIVVVSGLTNCFFGQEVIFGNEVRGMVIGFSQHFVYCIVFCREDSVAVGSIASSSLKRLEVPVGDVFMGRVVNSLGLAQDGKYAVVPADYYPVFRSAPGIMDRVPLYKPLETGIKIIDLAIPIGKGQRELIIGDRQIGKSSIAIDAIINQRGKDVVCIYCWIGGARSALKKHLYTLGRSGALEYTCVISAGADSSAAEQYLAPYTAAALGEYFMDKGRDVLVVFDDLTKHAWIYRQISLLLERSPGREAYPGDIFYLHSQLLERAACMKDELGGGSMTFLPIVETLQGDISGYIQTNLVSITDGQIYLSSSLFRQGFKPAIDVGLSVSRIGSKVQDPGIKEVSSGLRLEYAKYRELLRLTKLRTRMSSEAEEKMLRGAVLTKLLTQQNCCPVSSVEQIIIFFVFQHGFLTVANKETADHIIAKFYDYIRFADPYTVEIITKEKALNVMTKESIIDNVRSFVRALRAEDTVSAIGRRA